MNAGQKFDLVIRAEKAVLPTGMGPAQVGISDGRIAVVTVLDEDLAAERTLELAADEVLLPGLVDTHVHVNEPGRTDWEGFESATRAAAAGGVTTIIDMPLNSLPSTVNVPALTEKRAAAADQVFVDVGFWGGAIPGNTADLRPLHDEGVFGFKCFLLDSGVPEFPPLGHDEIKKDLTELAGFPDSSVGGGAMLIVHAEDGALIDGAPAAHGPKYVDFEQSRPPEAERKAISEVLEIAKQTGGRVHILHLADAGAIPLLRAAKADGVRVTVETCPHYLGLAAEDVPDGQTAYKCCPPIRGRSNRDALWQGLLDGDIDVIVTDHSPATVDLKAPPSGDFGEAWGGVASLQLGLRVVWTAARERGVELDRVISWMSHRTADLVGLVAKGGIAVGKDADLAIFAPEQELLVDPAKLHHKNPVTPYAGSSLFGVVRRTLLRGEEIGESPRGELLRQQR